MIALQTTSLLEFVMSTAYHRTIPVGTSSVIHRPVLYSASVASLVLKPTVLLKVI